MLRGKTALVTGGTQGIGAGIAAELARLGADVTAADLGAGDGSRVNAVAPGWIATPLTQALQDDPARAGPILARTPLGHWGTPQDVAQAVAFLCAPAAAFITGAILPVDGGYLVV